MNIRNTVSRSMLPVLFFMRITSYGQAGNNWVDGDLIEFKRNGAWCWFQDERAVVDTAERKLIIGSTGSGSGSIDVTIYDFEEKKIESSSQIGTLSSDDHNAPALLIRPDGKYIAMFADHYDRYNSHYSIYDGARWSYEQKFDWSKTEGFDGEPIAYSNLLYLTAEERIYNFARANNQTPNFLFSEDYGDTWKFGGRLSTDPSSTYNRGYYKYWGNGVDRIDFCNTQQHPRDTFTSIYHGFIKDGKTHNSFGEVVDSNVYDIEDLPTKDDFTTVFANGIEVNGKEMTRCWQSDITRYDDSTIAILFEARADNSINDHRNFYARFDGSEWKVTYIGKAGGPMYATEEDYTGLGALCPDDPDRIYISSPYNPGDDQSAGGKREIWRGSTGDNGKTWEWEAVTANSDEDNFRPIVPQWKPGREALLWFRGSYERAQKFTTKIVGIIHEYTVDSKEKNAESADAAPALFLGHNQHGSTVITLQHDLPVGSVVGLKLLDLRGRVVKQYHHGVIGYGSHVVLLAGPGNKNGIANGHHILQLKTESTTVSKSIVLFR